MRSILDYNQFNNITHEDLIDNGFQCIKSRCVCKINGNRLCRSNENTTYYVLSWSTTYDYPFDNNLQYVNFYYYPKNFEKQASNTYLISNNIDPSEKLVVFYSSINAEVYSISDLGELLVEIEECKIKLLEEYNI